MSPLKRTAPRLDLETVRDDVDKWYATKRQLNLIGQQLDKGKNALKDLVQKYGEADSKGSIFLDLEEPVGERKILQLKNQRSESTTINEEEAERILRRKGLYDEMTETIVQLDEGKVFAAYYDNKLTDDEIARMFNRRVSYSFYLLDVDGKPVS